MTTPASTPAKMTPAMAATDIQKSERFTAYMRRNSGKSIMPVITASVMTAPNTALGRLEKNGAKKIRVKMTHAPVARVATCDFAPALSLSELADRLVETGIP